MNKHGGKSPHAPPVDGHPTNDKRLLWPGTLQGRQYAQLRLSGADYFVHGQGVYNMCHMLVPEQPMSHQEKSEISLRDIPFQVDKNVY